MRAMSKGNDEIVHLPPDSAFTPPFAIFNLMFSIFILQCRVNNFVSRQRKNINGREESAKGLSFFDDFIKDCVSENLSRQFFPLIQKIQFYKTVEFSPSPIMATLRNKKRFTAGIMYNHEDHYRNNQASKTIYPRNQDDYITQMKKEIESRMTKTLFQEFSWTDNCNLGTLSQLDDFLLNPQAPCHSEYVRELSWSSSTENQRTNEDRFRSDPCLKLGVSMSQSSQELYAKVTTEIESKRDFLLPGHDRSSRRYSILLCRIFSRKKEGMLHKSSQFQSENNPAWTESDHILLACTQLADNSNSANFNNHINQNSKLPKSLTTSKPTFDSNPEKFELFEVLFQTNLKILTQLTELKRKLNLFILSWGMMDCRPLKTLKAQPGRIWENFWELSSMEIPEHKSQKFIFNPSNQKLLDFRDELQGLAKDAFGMIAHFIAENFIYDKMPHLK